MRWVLLGSASVLMACGGGGSASRAQGPGDASGSSSSGGGGGSDAWSDGDAGGGPGADGGGGGPGDAANAGSIAHTDGSPEAGTPNGMWVMGYYSGWDSSLYPVGEIDWAGLSHLAVAFYLFDSQGTIDESLSQGNAGQALGHSLVNAAHQAGKKAIASFGGAGSEAMWVGATSTANRATFEAHIRQVVGTYGYDGVDLDWEPFAIADHVALLALAQELRAAAPSYVITMPVGCENNNSPDDLSFYATLAPSVDRLNLMSYGLSGAWQGWKSWHSSPLHWNGDTSTPMGIDTSVDDYLKAGVPAAKLGIGSGFYGECYTSPVMAPDQALGGSTIAASDGTMSYAHIMGSYYSPAAQHWDTGAMVPYLTFASAHGPQNCTYVTYEDEQAIASKGSYAKAKGLGGVILWTINEGYIASAPAGQRSPLLEAMRTSFLN